MASALLGTVASNPAVQQFGKNIAGKASDKITGGVLGGIGGLIGGRKGKKIGKSIAKGMSSVRKSIFGFQAGGIVVGGGKVRVTPVKIRGGYVMGGQVVPAKPKRKSRRKK